MTFMFTPILGKMIQFDLRIILRWVVQPPASLSRPQKTLQSLRIVFQNRWYDKAKSLDDADCHLDDDAYWQLLPYQS